MSVLNYDENLRPAVTVVCITYNHEEYIRQALDSFLMQKTNFPFQIFVGEDKGPDSTADIVREYAEKYPDKIVAFLREENMGAQRNLIDMCQKAKSPYIAFCEGDDFWTDEYKLQKQYDLMEEHPEYRACVHATEILADDDWYLKDEYTPTKDGKIVLPYSKKGFNAKATKLTAEEYIKTTPAHTSSYFYRWNYDLVIPEWYYEHFAGDHSLMMLQTGKGLIGIIPDVMSVYRRSEVGVYYYSDRTTHYFNVSYSWTKLLMDIRDYFDIYYGGYCYKVITERIENGAVLYFKMMNELENYEDFLHHFEEDRETMMKMLEIVIRRASDYKQLLIFKWKNTLPFINSKKALNKQRRKNRLIDYQKFANVKKEPNLWLFTCNKGFKGDARYLYEYIIAKHPEINAVWVAKDKKEMELFVAENLPAVKIATAKSREHFKKASIIVTNSMKAAALRIRGFNAGSKVVRLYNPNYFELTENNPSPVYKQKPNSSEYYKDSFMVTAPCPEAVKYLSKKYELPEDRFFVTAAPRLEAVTDYMPAGKKILFIPDSFSKSILENTELELLEGLERINKLAEEKCFDFYYYCNSSSSATKKLKKALNNYDHIHLLNGDLYASLARFDALISGLSNYMFDFLTFDKPIVICSKNIELFKSVKKYTFDLKELLPGETRDNILDSLSLATVLLDNQDKDFKHREKVSSKFCNFDFKNENYSEKLFQEIVSRLNQNREGVL